MIESEELQKRKEIEQAKAKFDDFAVKMRKGINELRKQDPSQALDIDLDLLTASERVFKNEDFFDIAMNALGFDQAFETDGEGKEVLNITKLREILDHDPISHLMSKEMKKLQNESSTPQEEK